MELSVLAISVHEQAVADFKVSEKFAYSFIMNVKRIRDERLYKELGFSSFDHYCESSWKVVRRYMDQRIQIADAFGQSDFENTYSQIGHSKSLLLAQMEPEIKQQIVAESDVNELTVKQLKESEKRLQEAERIAEAERNSARHFEKLWTQAKNQPARVETKTVEVIPDNVKKQIEEDKFKIDTLRNGYQRAKEELEQLKLQRPDDFDQAYADKQKQKLQMEADIRTLDLTVHVKNFLEKAAISAYLHGAIASATAAEKKRLTDSVDMLDNFVQDIKTALRGRLDIKKAN